MTPPEASVGGYARSATLAGAIRLDLNEAPRDLTGAFRDRVLALLAEREWRRYPDMDGRSARGAAATLYGWRSEGTLVGNGSNDLLAAAIRALLPRGGSLAVLSPSFSMYPVLARRQEASLLRVNLEPPEFAPETEAVIERAAAADLVLLCSPNNPTGGELDAALWDEVLELGKPTVWDAAYAELGEADPVARLGDHENLLVLRSLSKAWGLAGLRVGAALGSTGLIGRVAQETLPFHTGALVAAVFQAAVELAPLGAELVREMVGERERLLRAAAALPGIEVVRSATNFFLVRRNGWAGSRLAGALAARGVAVRDVAELEASGHVRVTVGTPAEGDALLRALEEVGRG